MSVERVCSSARLFVTVSLRVSLHARTLTHLFARIYTAPNGKIYCVPKKADQIGVIDPSLSREIAFSVIDVQHVTTEDHKYSGAVLGSDGNIYFAPMRAPGIGILNPSSGVFSSFYIDDQFSENEQQSKFVGASLGPNGKIYFVPATFVPWIGVFDPGNHKPVYKVNGGVLPDSWRVLLAPQHNP